MVRNGRAAFVQVESGIMGSTDMEILKGVQPGDTIVTGSFSVLRTLKNNTKVRIENTPAIPNARGYIKGTGISSHSFGGEERMSERARQRP